MNGAAIVRGLVILAIIAYPIGVYFGIRVLPPGFFGLVLAVLLLLRFGVIAPGERAVLLPLLLPFLAYALVAAVLGSERVLLFYPVLVNACLFVIFVWSLRSEAPILLRIVRARKIRMSRFGPRYLYWLTIVWAGFFVLNGTISAWTITQPLKTWAVYNGLIAYVLIGVLIVGEWLFRIHYKKRKGVSRI